LLYAHGGFVDDILVHKVAGDSFFVCVNASNQDKDCEHIVAQNRWNCSVENAGPLYAQLAVQGPRALETLQKLTRTDLASIRYYWFTDAEVSSEPARIARTGYTGEDGFEIYVTPDRAVARWREILEAGREFGIKPIGLGARNTLRLEAKMALYGHEIDASITPLEADLAWIVKFNKGDFTGKAALEKQQSEGLKRKLVGFEMRGRGIARDGYEVRLDGAPAGGLPPADPPPPSISTSDCVTSRSRTPIPASDHHPHPEPACRSGDGANAFLQESQMNYPRITAIPRNMNGFAWKEMWARWASLSTPRANWATLSMSTCPFRELP